MERLKELAINVYMRITNNSLDEEEKQDLYEALEPFADGDFDREVLN